jgi:uncharacterized membrane protein
MVSPATMVCFSRLLTFAICGLLVGFSNSCSAQEGNEQSIVVFSRDIQPILAAKCLECHGPDEAKNDFRVDDAETMLSYVEPGDLESTSLWADYMVTDDPDLKMPPPSKPQLTASELAVFKLWIEEGAEWDEWKSEEVIAEEPTEEEAVAERSFAARVMEFQGLFHPASVHFPIALLAISTVFLCGSFIWKEAFESAAFHCLWIGAVGAVASCVMGWGYATHEGYGSSFSFDFQNSSIDRHRWLGIAVAVGGLILVPLASKVRKRQDSGMRFLWLVGSIALTLGVSITGYQGGELTYGEDHYEKEFNRLFPEYAASPEGSETSGEIPPEEEPSGDNSSGNEPEETDASDSLNETTEDAEQDEPSSNSDASETDE